MKEFYKDYLNKDKILDFKLMLGVFCLVIVFSGMFGFLYEFIFYFFNSGMNTFYMRGANFLPWINIYATGSIMIYFLTFKVRKKPLLVFLIACISTGILEYFTGYFMYILMDGIRCWNYDTEILSFLSINGFVCLRSVLIFGLSGLLLMYGVIPLFMFIAKNSNRKIFISISIILCSIFLLDEFYNLFITNMFGLPRASTIYKSFGFKYMNYYE